MWEWLARFKGWRGIYYVHEEHPTGTEYNGFHDQSAEFVALGVNKVIENAFDIELVFGTVLSFAEIHYIFQVAVFLWWPKNVLKSCWRFNDPRPSPQFDGWEIKPCYGILACVIN